MNPRLKYCLLFILFGAGAYGSSKLWMLAPHNATWNTISLIIMLLVGAVALGMLIKVFLPKTSISDLFDMAISVIFGLR